MPASSLQSSHALAPIAEGDVLAGKYRVERVVGEGGMGVVVVASDTKSAQRVAIKVLRADMLDNPEMVERFKREARVAAKVKSEHVIHVHGVGALENGAPFLVMDYLDGKTFEELVDRNGALEISDACEYMLQACEGVAKMHAAGIIHRDLKPGNLYCTKDADGLPVVKIIDFGISKFMESAEHTRFRASITGTQAIIGSPGYMSPEQMRSSRKVDARSDIWALGTILYELLTAQPAFVAETMAQLCGMILAGSPPPPSSMREELPPRLEQAIMRCLEKEPAKRFRHVGELARVLAEFAPKRARPLVSRIEEALGSLASTDGPAETPDEATTRDLGEEFAELRRPAGTLTESVAIVSEQTRPEIKRKRSGGALLALAALVGFGAYAVYSGRLDMGPTMKAATDSVVRPAASAITTTLRSLESPPEPTSATAPVMKPVSSAPASSSSARHVAKPLASSKGAAAPSAPAPSIAKKSKTK